MRKALHFEERSTVEEHLSLMGNDNDTWPRGTRVLPLPNSTLQIEEGGFPICHVSGSSLH